MTDDTAGKTPEFAFLRAGAASGRPWRDLILTLLLGGVAGFIALIGVTLVVFLLAAAILSAASSPQVGLLKAVGILSDVGRGGRSLQSYVFELSIAGLSSYVGALAFLAVAARVERRPILSFLTAAPRFRWRQVGLGLAIFLPIVGLAIGLTNLLDPHPTPPPLFTPGAAPVGWKKV